MCLEFLPVYSGMKIVVRLNPFSEIQPERLTCLFNRQRSL